MVSGPMHYTEAESALDQSAQVPPEMALLYATQAVAHATLALAAATLDAAVVYKMDGDGRPAGTEILLDPAATDWAGVLK